MKQNALSLRREWSSLRHLEVDEVLHVTAGDLAATFVPPLTRIAPVGLGLIGLRHWYGKRFVRAGGGAAGMNLVWRGGSVAETLPMTLTSGVSLADGKPALVVEYAADAPRPWRWVRDELRAGSDGTVVGMTFVDLFLLRSVGGTPFLLIPKTE
ncbi:hypothetical protein H9L21_11210 [Aeromicrobium senzhongii]|uniref:DUF4166 domain-containing protein n=1 Tax=Aeromicrobium senzhongii TaxID=2663859 RepID=A0ABX6SQL8_9ACTN|nr:hypothetical protein [Aeromicrobium senzhongii]MTB89055.1 hypothetical protein [Aeromicrobium senzhongii]QNL93674.1 hypothetical protein H9L21_11210 [Aeromicrobium senzhongii]